MIFFVLVSDGFGFSTSDIGLSLLIASIPVIFLQLTLVTYVRKTLKLHSYLKTQMFVCNISKLLLFFFMFTGN